MIIATALQREPARRYPTAAAFADDLRRWLDGRPITARADSGAYRLAKFVRRHRIGVAAAALIVLSLVGGLGVALWQARIATAEARRADNERAHAERQLARTERVKEFILALFREQDPIARAKAQGALADRSDPRRHRADRHGARRPSPICRPSCCATLAKSSSTSTIEAAARATLQARARPADEARRRQRQGRGRDAGFLRRRGLRDRRHRAAPRR